MRVININSSLTAMSSRLSRLSDTPLLDAQVLLAYIINQPRAWVLAHPEYKLSHPQLNALDAAAKKLESGMPLPYILRYWEFYGRKFYVNPDVLIPRPETELIVEKALSWLNNNIGMTDQILAADIGCGSGCIGISLAVNFPALHIIAGDISAGALKVTSQNAALHSVTSRLHPVQCDLIPPISTKFNLICANLPYIPSDTLSQLNIYKKEPSLALDGGKDGLEIISRLLKNSATQITPGGLMLLEIESSQGQSVKNLARSTFPDAEIQIFQDLAGHDRLLSIQKGK